MTVRVPPVVIEAIAVKWETIEARGDLFKGEELAPEDLMEEVFLSGLDAWGAFEEAHFRERTGRIILPNLL